jgi:predicted metalloprotease
MRLLCVLLLALLLVGCGGDDVRERVDRAREQLERKVAENYKRARDEFRKRRERFGKRIEQVLDDLERAVPRAERTDPTVRSRGRNEATTIDAFLTDVLKDIDGYWTQTFAASDLPEPRVRYVWVPPGRRVQTGCGTPADDRAAFYCPADDTIYVAQRFASDLYAGVARGLPGESSGFGRAAGDFAVAYVLATSTRTTCSRSSGSSTTA